MTTDFSIDDNGYFARTREIFIRLSILTAMAVSCYLLMLPFLKLIVSGIIIAIGVYPGYRMLTKALNGRSKLAATLCTVLLLAVMIVPVVLLAGTLVEGITNLVQQAQTGRLKIPLPPASLDKVPVIGHKVADFWTQCSTDVSKLVNRLSPEIQKQIPAVLSASAGAGGLVLQFLFSVLLAGYLLATSEANSRFADKLFMRIFGPDLGLEFKDLVAATVRSVTNGILGVAVIQTLCATIGFWAVGLPGTGLWAFLFLVAAVLQFGIIVLIPAVLYAFAVFPTSHAVMFLIWCIVVGLMDNVLKPVLLGRGCKVPMPVIFLGVLGGFMLMRVIGLFVGAIILAVGYKLFMAWLDYGAPSKEMETAEPPALEVESVTS